MSDIIRMEEQCAIYARAIMDCDKERRDLRADRDRLREALTRAAENMKVAAEFHDCVNCGDGHTQARTALAFARTIEKYDGALAALAQEP